MLPTGTPALLRDGHVIVPTLQALEVSSDHQRKQLPSGAPNMRGNIETQRTRWLSRVNPVARSWSLKAYPRSPWPVSPSDSYEHLRRIPSEGASAGIGALKIVPI